jgi:hypothetical protein
LSRMRRPAGLRPAVHGVLPAPVLVPLATGAGTVYGART